MKEKYAHLALIGAGAVIVLYVLIKYSQAQNSSAVIQAAPASTPTYPNSAPIQMGNIEIGGSPINLTYNTSPPFDPDSRVEIAPGRNSATPGGSCSCEDDSPCAEVPGQPVTVQQVPEKVYVAAHKNLLGFQLKMQTPTYNSGSQPPASIGLLS